MKKNEIKVGGHYLMKVSGSVVTVRVDSVGVGTSWHGSRERTTWYCKFDEILKAEQERRAAAVLESPGHAAALAGSGWTGNG